MHGSHHKGSINWRRISSQLAVALVAVGAGIALNMLLPGLAFAQGDDPFAGAEDGFLKFLDRLKFWVWGFSALGLAFYVIAFGGQSLWPSWYSSMRDFLKTGAILLVVFNIVFTFLHSQATSAKDASGGVVIMLPYLIWRMRAEYVVQESGSTEA